PPSYERSRWPWSNKGARYTVRPCARRGWTDRSPPSWDRRSSTTRRERGGMADMLVSPLAHRAEDLAAVGASTHGGVTIEEIVGLRQIDVRLAPDLADRLPFEVPLEPNTFL